MCTTKHSFSPLTSRSIINHQSISTVFIVESRWLVRLSSGRAFTAPDALDRACQVAISRFPTATRRMCDATRLTIYRDQMCTKTRSAPKLTQSSFTPVPHLIISRSTTDNAFRPYYSREVLQCTYSKTIHHLTTTHHTDSRKQCRYELVPPPSKTVYSHEKIRPNRCDFPVWPDLSRTHAVFTLKTNYGRSLISIDCPSWPRPWPHLRPFLYIVVHTYCLLIIVCDAPVVPRTL